MSDPTTPTISALEHHVDQTVTLQGWLYNKRGGKKMLFLIVRDGTGLCQAIVSRDELGEALFEQAAAIDQESAIRVTGTVRADARAPGGHELHVQAVELVHAASEYPITKKEHGVDFLLRHRHLWLRSRKQHATLRVRATVVRAIRDYLDDHGFLHVDAPVFTPAACEGTTTLFQVDYFGEPAYLTQSGQLYMEAAAMAHGKVYCFGPAFRAEKSKTRRHLTEFWMVEPEIAYGDMDDALAVAEGLLAHIVERVLTDRRADLTELERDLAPLEAFAAPFEQLTYDDAIKQLEAGGSEISWGEDFGAPDEKLLTETRTAPLVIRGFPAKVKAFYMKRDPERDEMALGFDILAPEGYGEIVGGGQRADSLEFLEQQIEQHQLPKEAFEWYLDLRRYGSVPHSGFGLGLERTVAWLCGTHHIRETIPFPRMLHKIYP